MARKNDKPAAKQNLPVTRQTAGGLTGAVVGSVIAGPVGALVGGVAGAIMGDRSAQGKTLVPATTVKAAKKTVTTLQSTAASLKPAKPKPASAPAKKSTTGKKAAGQRPKKPLALKTAPKGGQQKKSSAKGASRAKTVAKKGRR